MKSHCRRPKGPSGLERLAGNPLILGCLLVVWLAACGRSKATSNDSSVSADSGDRDIASEALSQDDAPVSTVGDGGPADIIREPADVARLDDGPPASPDAVSNPDAICSIDNPNGGAPIPICCDRPETRPGWFPGQSCYSLDAVEWALANCVMVGGVLAPLDRAVGRHCCAGSSPQELIGPVDGGQCDLAGPPGRLICTNCGDGTCGPGENICNCAADCRAASDAGTD